MQFYLYLLKEMLGPVCATILFLKDGQIERVTPEETREFEEKLRALLEREE